MKPAIFSSLPPEGQVLTAGTTGDNKRLLLAQRVHSGPKPTMDREVILVMDEAEALSLATELLGRISIGHIESSTKLGTLKKLLDIIERRSQ